MKDMKEKLRDMENRMRKFKLNLIVVRKQQLELDMEQQTASKSGKECIKAVYCHPAYLTFMQSTSGVSWAGGSTSWNQDCWEKYQ